MNTANPSGSVHFEPSLGVTFLPRCAECHAPHPLARKPAMPAEKCPDCGAAQVVGPTQHVRAVLTGKDFYSRVARFCFAAADVIKRLLERL